MANVPKRLPLEPQETVREAWVAGIPSRSGRTAKWGGTLVLTDRRLIFEPLRVPAMADEVYMGELGPEYRIVCPLADLDLVEAVPDRRAMLRLHARTGATVAFLISAGRMTPSWSRKNTIARDAAVETIRRSLGRPRAQKPE